MKLFSIGPLKLPLEIMRKINYEETEEFRKDLKGLLKRFPTLKEDLELAKRTTIELFHLQELNNHSIFPIPRFCSEKIMICKIKKFACRALKGRGARSGMRIIYAFLADEDRVIFVEIYFKGNQDLEDQNRIKSLLKALKLE